MTWVGSRLDFEIAKYNPNIANAREIWNGPCEKIWDNLLCYDRSELYWILLWNNVIVIGIDSNRTTGR